MARISLAISTLLASGVALSGAAAAETWIYKEVQDKFTDKKHVIATNDSGAWGAQNDFKVSFECRNGREFVFTVDAKRDLGGKKEPFEFIYRADGKKRKKVRMVTFTNSETGGMNKTKAIEIANDFLNADRLIVRAVSADNDEYDAEIALDGAYASIVRTVVACGMSISG